jgi:hypothetical protein
VNKNFITMKQNVGSRIGDGSTAMLSLIGGYLNDRMVEVRRRSNILDINRCDYAFSTVAGTEDYVLPQDFGKEIAVRDATNKAYLKRLDSQSNMMLNTSTADDQGGISNYIILDKTVRTQPTASSVITFVSSSASDTSQKLYVKGFDANGYEDYEEVTVTGTTPVATSKSFTRVLLVAKSAVTVGTITVTSNSAAVTIAVLSRAMLEHRIKVMRLVNIPNSVCSIDVIYLANPLPMSGDYDYPIINCADVLEAGAEADAWRFKRQFAKASDLDVIFEKRLANLLFDTENQPNKINKFRPMTYSGNMDSGNITDNRYGIF